MAGILFLMQQDCRCVNFRIIHCMCVHGVALAIEVADHITNSLAYLLSLQTVIPSVEL